MSILKENEKSLIGVKNAGALIFLPAFFTGFIACFSPYALANLLVFFIVLSVFARKKRQVLLLGLCFFISVLCSKNLFFNEFVFFHFSNKRTISIIRSLDKIIAFAFIVIGAVSFFDWISIKKNFVKASSFIKLPAFLKFSDKDGSKNSAVKYEGCKDGGKFKVVLIFSVFLGFFLTLMESIWPQDYLFFVQNILLQTEGEHFILNCRLVIYAMFFASPILFFCAAIIKVSNSVKMTFFIIGNISFYKILVSAVYLSMGVALFQII